MNNLLTTINTNEIINKVNALPLKTLELDNIKDYDSIDGDWLIQLFLDGLNSKSTKDSYRKSISEWFQYCYGNKIVTLKDIIINNSKAIEYTNIWKTKIRKNTEKSKDTISISTYNSKIKGIRSFYNWLKLETRINNKDFQYIKYNPFDAVSMMDETDSIGSMALTPDEIMLMFNNPYGKTEHMRERNLLIFELALTTGLRNDTLLGLTFGEIQNIEDSYIIKKLTKHHKLTIKPITDLYDRLIKWYNFDVKNRAVDNGTIFNLHPISANEMIKKWIKAVDINKHVTFHGLRATCAILIYHDTGENKYRVQKFLDHSNMKVTGRYVDKEQIVDHSGENAFNNLKQKQSQIFDFTPFNQEQFIDAIMKLDFDVQSKIMHELKKGE